MDNVIINGFSGDAKSAIRIGSNDHIKFSGKTAIQGFDQVELNANSIEVLKGVKFQSKLDDQEIPSGYFIVNSLDSAVFNGATIHGGFVVNSDGNITVTDINMGEGEAKVHSNVLKLNAEGKVYFGAGDLGVPPSVWTRMLNINGSDIEINRAGLSSNAGLSIIGSKVIRIEGPANIQAFTSGALELAIEAPEVYINNNVSIRSNAEYLFGITGKIKITGSQELLIKDSNINLSNDQLYNERPKILLNGGNITIDDSNISQMAYYNYINRFGEVYS